MAPDSPTGGFSLQNAQDIRDLSHELSDFRSEVSVSLGTLVEGQANISRLLEKHDAALDKVKEDVAEARGGLKVTKIIGSIVAFLVGLGELLVHWKGWAK